jgi:hypothetical protein
LERVSRGSRFRNGTIEFERFSFFHTPAVQSCICVALALSPFDNEVLLSSTSVDKPLLPARPRCIKVAERDVNAAVDLAFL